MLTFIPPSSIISHPTSPNSLYPPLTSWARTHSFSSRPLLPSSNPASLAPHVPGSLCTSPKPAGPVLTGPSSPPPVSSSLLPVLVGQDGFAVQNLPPCAARRGGDVAAPVDVVRRAAGADAGDDVDVVAAAALFVIVDAEVVAGAADAVLAVVPANVLVVVVLHAVALPAVLAAVEPAAVGPAAVDPVDVDAGVGSMTHRARGECWVQQALKVLTVAELAVAVVAGGECETAWLGTMSCVSGRTVGVDLVRDSFAKLGRVDAKMAGDS